MDDLISRQNAIDILDAFQVKVENGEEFSYSWARMRMTELPPAQPEIIRCKDCKYYRWEINMCDEPFSTAHNVVHEYDYCSKAERRTDE